MSFFELDGGAKKRAPAKKASGKKAPAKKSSGKKAPAKKTKKGGNFLGTVSELFAPAGWENFVTAAGLLALDRTDNYLRKSKDSKKQKGGEDAVMMEEAKMEEPDMTGGARKRSSSRKQRGGSDGHHTIEALDAMMGGEEPEMTAQPDAMSQTGGAKKRSSSRSKPKSKPKSKGKARKHKGGAMEEEEKKTFLRTYHREPVEAKKLIEIYDIMNKSNIPNNNSKANTIISKVIETHSQTVNAAPASFVGNNPGVQQSLVGNNQIAQPNEGSLFGGKPKSKSSSKKSKSSTKKPKSKKTKGRK